MAQSRYVGRRRRTFKKRRFYKSYRSRGALSQASPGGGGTVLITSVIDIDLAIGDAGISSASGVFTLDGAATQTGNGAYTTAKYPQFVTKHNQYVALFNRFEYVKATFTFVPNVQ